MVKYDTYSVVTKEVPGNISLAFTITGCKNSCKGCHSQWLANDTGTSLCFAMYTIIVNKYIDFVDCVCFLGEGDGLTYLLEYSKRKYPNLKLCVYSGKNEVNENYLQYPTNS